MLHGAPAAAAGDHINMLGRYSFYLPDLPGGCGRYVTRTRQRTTDFMVGPSTPGALLAVAHLHAQDARPPDITVLLAEHIEQVVERSGIKAPQ
ncbi:hypothetical protein ACNPQM_24115 [Streptomyces sp. NPDC056231]|uniref:hypothetical protein n=1 Tax=Streptomyces sp. NPDC056231 TaxID=3345755 RepID=UPI003AAF12EF